MKELEKAELCAAGSGYQVYDRLGSVNHLMKEFIEEDTKGIPKFCITWVVNSNMLPYKKQWLDKYYPGEIKTIYGTSIPEQKINTMKQLADKRYITIDELAMKILGDAYDENWYPEEERERDRRNTAISSYKMNKDYYRIISNIEV